ncbi:HNH endonuclease family protein [Hydrogenophaga sp. RAC07]|uniref:HNH endonuclease n=1 Tax=Hydrogenophaga sp. RAC07 TaxID=1842537 RepID=UPI0008569173|nr:HNH endonuclease [Hydrogenophaga sp. RAC07]AOF86568.1 HNH endonuclease family protein [Hydrogenophaga sp. RAC07]
MTAIQYLDLKSKLPPTHLEALRWFEEHAGQDVRWPQPLSSGTYLVNKAKGIHKPAGWQHALSIRQSLGGPYPDKDPEVRGDGSWVYHYFQEAPDVANRDLHFTNKALLACMRDRVPVGVMRQIKAKPDSLYHVLGVALISEWKDGYFILEGDATQEDFGTRQADELPEQVEFIPSSIEDARQWITRSIVRRQGQGEFRAKVLSAYGNKCAITGFNAMEAIEAAHIFPYMGQKTNAVPNGLALRGDIHTLFDLGMLVIHPVSLHVELSPSLTNTTYAKYQGIRIHVPNSQRDRPSQAALEAHYAWATAEW